MSAAPTRRVVRSKPLAFALLAAVCVLSALIALRIGASSPSLANALRDASSFDRRIFEARAARVLLSAIAGAALAVVGAAFQALLRNPLGDPYALGVSGGAALFATAAMIAGASIALVPAAAFAGALFATAGVLATARAVGRVDARGLLLAGLVFNACSSALLTLLRSVAAGSKAQETLALLLGSIAEERASTVALVGALCLVGFALLFALGRAMDLLSLGEDTAASLGLDVRRAEIAVFVAASLMVGGVVSVCGLIPFVGLIVPHYARALVGAKSRALVPACALLGASLLMLADALARGLFTWLGSEVPVGVFTALLGGPFFFVALRGRDGQGLRAT